MTANGELFRPTLQEFPEPSRPLHAYGTSMEPSSSSQEYGFSDQYFDEVHDFEEHEQGKRYVNDDDDDDLKQMLSGFVDELDEKSRKMLKKLFAKVEKDVPFERLFRETLRDFRGGHVSEKLEKFHSKLNSDPMIDPSSRDRGLNGDSDELKHKLERFKVKTIRIVKKEQK